MFVFATVALLAPACVAVAQGQVAAPSAPEQVAADAPAPGVAWWVWPSVLFAFCFGLGIIAVVAGIGGGVLFVPLVASFFPFHIDFVRSTGLLMALSGAMAAGPGLLRRRLADFRLVLCCTVFGSLGSLSGACVGLIIDPNLVQLSLGICILLVAMLMLKSSNVEFPTVGQGDRLASLLGLGGVYHEASLGVDVAWQVHRTPLGLLMFVGVGFLGGMFGLGAGWASVPLMNLVLGVPLKLAVGSSVFMLMTNAPPAAWIYLRSGAWMPLLAIPSIVGLMLGTSLGVKVLGRTRVRSVRYVVIVVLIVAAVRSIQKGLGW